MFTLALALVGLFTRDTSRNRRTVAPGWLVPGLLVDFALFAALLPATTPFA